MANEGNNAIDSSKWRDPTESELESAEFNAVWEAIKRWDVNVPDIYEGYMGSCGNHVTVILGALKATRDKAIADAVQAERSRCHDYAYAMRCGDIDDIRSVISGIDGGHPFETEEQD